MHGRGSQGESNHQLPTSLLFNLLFFTVCLSSPLPFSKRMEARSHLSLLIKHLLYESQWERERDREIEIAIKASKGLVREGEIGTVAAASSKEKRKRKKEDGQNEHTSKTCYSIITFMNLLCFIENHHFSFFGFSLLSYYSIRFPPYSYSH